MTKQIPTEVLIQRIRDASVNGLAPSSQELSSTYKQLRKRGIEWSEACVMAGVRQRPKGRPPKPQLAECAHLFPNTSEFVAPCERGCGAWLRSGDWPVSDEPRWHPVGSDLGPIVAKPRRRWWHFGRAKAA